MKDIRALLGIGALACMLVACSPVVRTHGYTPLPEQLERIQIGQDTRGSVRRKIGRPSASGAFTDDAWYYVSSTVEHVAFYAPEVVDRQVIAVEFDENDLVSAVNRYGMEDGRVIDLETATTPTHGRQLTLIEQLLLNLSNIGATETQ